MKSLYALTQRLGARVVLVASLAGAPLIPTSAHAEPSRPTTQESRFEALLDAIDVVPPDGAALLAAFPDAEARLLSVAEDARRSTWHRQRALSLLSFLPSERTRGAVLTLCDDPNRDLAGLATYTLGRAFGSSLSARELALLERRALDTAPDRADQADQAVRALRWVDHPEAQRILTRVITETKASRPERSRLAATTQSRRQARLSR